MVVLVMLGRFILTGKNKKNYIKYLTRNDFSHQSAILAMAWHSLANLLEALAHISEYYYLGYS